ncbi:MAG: sodium:proton antiporter [Bacteroidetes bacterium]|nr:sodium:proton antiporter [Bacteroidota bacterium]MCL6099481.1 sodium:proton antiporter [Bacteroidota bacterium]
MSIPLLSLLPFVLILLAIAILPLYWNHRWEQNKNKLIIASILSLPIILFLVMNGLGHRLLETLFFDYIPFIVLLAALFIITGGIHLSGDIEAKPLINLTFLSIGAILASIMGTTGAAMLLIRPIIQTNKEREFKVHTILFFIAVVANCGGLLTPIGDPPLFMLYLRGVPFTWFLKLLPEWLFANGLLLLIYFIVDSYYYKKEKRINIISDKIMVRSIKVNGGINFVWLAGVILSIAFLNQQYIDIIHMNEYYKFIREVVIIFMAVFSLILTPRRLRKLNNFSWAPIEEVAYLFFGIFITMIPCLLYLESNAKSLGVNSAFHFFYATGALSGILDNTPTAVTFYSLAHGLGIHSSEIVAGIPGDLLKAISLGAVFFGSITYIGNAPNFMVKAIAEDNNITMPDFISYILKFSLVVLLPIFILVQLIFIK